MKGDCHEEAHGAPQAPETARAADFYSRWLSGLVAASGETRKACRWCRRAFFFGRLLGVFLAGVGAGLLGGS